MVKTVMRLYKIFILSMILLLGCKKEEETKPVSTQPTQYCDWYLTVNGNDTTEFKVNFISSVPPYMFITYQAKCNVSPIKIHMIVGAFYAVQFRDINDSIQIISHNPNSTIAVYDTIPATIL